MLSFINILINMFGPMRSDTLRLLARILPVFVLLTNCSALLVYGMDSTGVAMPERVYILPLREEVAPGLVRQVSAGLAEADEWGADIVVVHMNTYGGMLDAADSIRTRFLNYDGQIITFIDNNAASAGALIAISTERIYMRQGASIGAATVVNQSAEALPDKYQSYMRAMMRATAEKRGRDPLVAEAMVDPRTVVPGVIDSGRVLTLTTSEAIELNYCEGSAETISDVLKLEGIANAKQRRYEPTSLEKVIGFLVNPAVSGLLLLVIMGGIYFELQSPGIGFPLIAAITAAVLYFAPLYLEGLAANWEILIAVLGFLLILVEIFVLPGFGIAGITGVLLLITGFTFSMLGNDGLDFTFVPPRDIAESLAMVLSSAFLSVFAAYFIGKKLLKTHRFGRLVLQQELSSKEGYVSSAPGLSDLTGSEGVTVSELRPSGKVRIGSKTYSASADRGFIERGREIVVIRFDGITLWVKEK
jgi:membrane-bound serine protease (ClpP class)